MQYTMSVRAWLVFSLAFAYLIGIICEISDQEYALMPELFFMDNFDLCMLRGDKALYCTITFELTSLNANNTIWNLIQNVSADPRHYNHRNLRHGVCVPFTCPKDYKNDTSTRQALNDCYRRKMSPFDLTGNVTQIRCQGTKSIYTLDGYDWVFAVFSATYILFVLLATLCSKANSSHKVSSTVSKFVDAFSVSKNWKRLIATSGNPDHRKLRIIQGLRFCTMVCVIFSHTMLNIFSGPVSNTQYTEKITKNPLNMMVMQGWYVVQTFFIISGWLFSYQFFEKKLRQERLNAKFFLLAIFYRYIRLAPTLIVVWAIHSTWYVHFLKGPYWDDFVGEEYRNCRENGWTNLLFINNFVYKNNMCLQQTWFLAADMQLFIVSLAVLYIVNKYPEKLFHIFGFVLAVGLFIPGIVAYVKGHDILHRQIPENLYKLNSLKMDVFHDLVTSTYSNMFGFFNGMLGGYFFLQYRDHSLRHNKVLVVLWWILSFGLCLSVLFIAFIFYDPNFYYTRLGSALYWMFGKSVFSIGMAIALFGMTHKIGGIVYWLMSRDVMMVLGRLTYSCYLIHVLFTKMNMGVKRYPIYIENTTCLFLILGDVTVSYASAFLLCLLVEMPVSALQKMMLPKSPEKLNQQAEENLCTKV